MRIGEVAERTALSFRSLRHWDDVGLVQPSARTEGGFRLYTEKDVERILIIRRMKPLGYTLDEMRELLDVVDALTIHPSDIALRARIDEIRDGADQRRQKLTEQLAMADEFVQLLGQL
ncbi:MULTISPECIES: MerR family transcriptional regulator [Microbacterium]|uniref:MerR family transcriptional regulator n=1 Tax=Microbacterium wangchenii TaxID=2541726 RepID=A0ABX5SXT2_9MICO|nr:MULTISPECIES: MerR family transcriptional regulator [Microbacterium]MCK6065739.1 MerR family transcriptional regulator [Microbacterium sp. EYE_512]QBR90057.1 MerR family transcriptional regulator [Microbacterium wangchenii]